jgi:hypothetical protein
MSLPDIANIFNNIWAAGDIFTDPGGLNININIFIQKRREYKKGGL